MWACGCGGCARGCARVGCICLGVQSPFRMHRCAYHVQACVCVCVQCVAPFLWLRPVRPHICSLLRGGRGPHARVVRGRDISSTKVTALPDFLCRCKLLEELCVPPAAAVRVRGGAGAALLRARCRAGRRATPRGVGCGGGGVAGRRPRRAPRTHGWRARPTGARSGWARARDGLGARATPSSRRCRRRPTGRA